MDFAQLMKGLKMGILTNLILSVIHIVLIGIDTLFFLILVRMLSYRWQTRWLMALNSMGKPAVDWFTGYIEKGLKHFSKNAFSERTMLFIGMLILVLVRFFLVTLFS